MSQGQKPIDLLPETIRARCLKGVRTGQTVAAVIAAAVLVIVAATHARFDLDRARDRLFQAEAHADLVLATEAHARELRKALDEVREHIDTHDMIVLPLELSALLATLVNQLPPGVGLDRIDLEAQIRRQPQRIVRPVKGTAVSTEPEETRPRVLVGEVTGFAANDNDVAELVSRMENTPPFQAVSLDYSRTRMVRGVGAREFRISFRVDLDVRYASPHQIAAAVSEEGQP